MCLFLSIHNQTSITVQYFEADEEEQSEEEEEAAAPKAFISQPETMKIAF